MKFDERIQAIRFILSDVDGVMTDGRITYDNQGVELKTFHVRDGLGIKVWQRTGHQFGILTARTSHIVKLRAAELGVSIVRQGFEDKLPVARQLIESLDLEPREVCYIGDDLSDLRVMQFVGLAAAVSDAAPEVRQAADWVAKSPGGAGAVRELVEMLLKKQKRWNELLADYTGQ